MSADQDYTGAAPLLHVWHGNAETRYYLDNLADLIGLGETERGSTLAGQEVTYLDLRVIRQAVIWVDQRGVHVENWTSRWLSKRRVRAVVERALEAHDSLPHLRRPDRDEPLPGEAT